MISIEKAKQIVRNNLPHCKIERVLPYNGQYIISAPTSDPLEGDMDPFYSVDMETGEFRDFPILLAENEFVFNIFCMEEGQ